DKDSCADAGFLKIDLLGLGMLSAVERAVDEIGRARGEHVDLSRIPLDDEEVYESIRAADTTGVFQIESRAQMQMLPRTLPKDLDDLTVQVALVRPGPIQGGAVHPYIERRKRLREDPSYEIPYEHPSLEPVLRDTLGAIVFQDQVLEVAIALAGFSVGEAEGLRRAMSRKRSEAALRRYRERFIEGAVGRGVRREVAERVYGQIEGFSGFGFPKSHSAAFGLLAYQSTWLRVHYGPELLCALLNEQPMGFYPPDALVHEAQRRGIEVLPPDVNASEVDCRVETVGAAGGSAGQPPVRIGLGYVAEVAEADAEAVVVERRRGGAYRGVADLAGRSGATGAALQRLAWAGACDRLVRSQSAPMIDPDEEQRRPALWEAGGAARASRTDQGTQLALALDATPSPPLPPLGPWDRIIADYRTTGMTLGEHPMSLMRAALGPEVADSGRLAKIGHGRQVRVAGMVVARQRPATAKGIVFMLLEDERGTINLIVPPPVVESCRMAIRSSGFVIASGRLEHREGTTNVLVSRIERLSRSVEDRDGLPVAPARAIAPPVGRETGRDDTGRSSDIKRVAPRSALASPRIEADGVWRGGSRPSRRGRKAAREGREIISELDRPAREQIVAELAAALPPGHSFGRRGR
ncbi:MAG: OB-fold nucleic acid binding domain-containing protein, partial [Solirubrobacterales bacterium]